MRRNTIKWRIFRFNILIIIGLIVLTAIIFNVAVRFYIEKDVLSQLDKIAVRTEETALRQGPDFIPGSDGNPMPMPPRQGKDDKSSGNQTKTVNDLYRFYFMLDRSLREPLSVLNADYVLFDTQKKVINLSTEQYQNIPDGLLKKITSETAGITDNNKESYLDFSLSGTEYIALVKPVSQKNTFGLGWIVIYSSLQKVNQLKWVVNLILLSILLLTALITVFFSSLAARKITEPFSTLNRHIGAIAERNFGNKIDIPVYDELKEFVDNINLMSEKLETYDKAQKTFLQNASHEFRTPLMSIQSYAEGIKYNVVENDAAADIIIDETKRMTGMIEELLYLSRLDAIEENYRFYDMDFRDLINGCTERMNVIAAKSGINIELDNQLSGIVIFADEEKLMRALSNIISNCIRYAKSSVKIAAWLNEGVIELLISDDGPGFDPRELPYIFERFYKGKKGNFGLGLAISKNVIDRHNGKISAENLEIGAQFKIELPVKV